MKLKTFWFLFFFTALFYAKAQTVTAGFNVPDTVCSGTEFDIFNTSANASTYKWNFCSADPTNAPTVESLGSFSGLLDQPVFMDYVRVGNEYFAFVTNYRSGHLIRLDFGSSLLNSPSAVDLGNFAGTLPSVAGDGGIQIVQNEGNWYAIIVAGYPPGGASPRLVKISFGIDIKNTAPSATNWGNVGGSMHEPMDLQLILENGKWYGFTINAETNTIARFDFGDSFENFPTGTNLGNLGNLLYPTGLFVVNDNGNWRFFITDAGDESRIGGIYSLTRLDFGNSILNNPAATDIGNIGHSLQNPHDLVILKSCDDYTGYILNSHPLYNNLVRIKFNGDLSNEPTSATINVNGGNLDYAYSITKFQQVNDEAYGFIVSKGNNSITRISFRNCTNSSTLTSALKDPPPISYNLPGTYTISLTVDEGLATEAAFCREVVVNPCYDSIIITNDTTICASSDFQIKTLPGATYQWSPATYLDDPTAANPITSTPENITYYVEATIPGRADPIRDSVHLKMKIPFIKTNEDTTVCAGSPVQLNVERGGFFTWSPGTGLSNAGVPNPIARPEVTTEYHVIGVDPFGCLARDSVLISVIPGPEIAVSNDTMVCKGATVPLSAVGGISYQWSPAAGLSDPEIANPVASAPGDQLFKVKVTGDNACTREDSVKISVRAKPQFSVLGSPDICEGASVNLSATGGDAYHWTSSAPLSDASSPTVTTAPSTNTTYRVEISENVCHYDTAIIVEVKVHSVRELSSVPNAFSPNGDGKNDCLGISRWGDATVEQFIIYNRWGQIVFQTKNASECWDGTSNGTAQPSGGYIYVIRANTVCGLITHKGSITLVR